MEEREQMNNPGDQDVGAGGVGPDFATRSAATHQPDKERVLVVIPTYDEVDNIEPIVSRVRAAVSGVDILIVDDNSPDGTGLLADRLAASDGAIHVLHRSQRAGLGRAYVEGFRWALDRGYTVVVEMDADGSHDPSHLGALLNALEGADAVIGSRWVDGGSVVNWPRSRELISRGGNLYARMMLRLPVRDATGGYRAYRRAVLEAIDVDSVASQGYCFQVDLTWRAVRAGFRIAEVPIAFRERERGESKMNSSIVLEAFWRVTVWGAAERVRRAKNLVRRRRSVAGPTIRRDRVP